MKHFDDSRINHDPVLLTVPSGFALRVILLLNQHLALPEERQGLRCYRLPVDAGLQGFSFVDVAIQATDIVQSLLKEDVCGNILIQVVTLAQQEHVGQEQYSTGIAALLRTLSLENPRFRCQHIEIEWGESSRGLLHKLEQNLADLVEASVRYRNGVREVKVWEQVPKPDIAPLPWRQRDGVYLITGGTGGLGLIFAEAIAKSVDNPALILVGRSAPDAARRARIDQLAALGARVENLQVDVSREQEATHLLDHILNTYGRLHGILHAAGVILDSYLLNKTAEEVRAVLAPKVAGTLYLDHASQELDLDFFAVFSSIAGAMGNPGQADYAMGNAFMDAFAEHRNELVTAGQRKGRTLSINWPLWRDGGMRLDETTEMLMRQHTGLEPLESEEGLQAFSDCMASGLNQVMVAVGQEAVLLGHLAPAVVSPLHTEPATIALKTTTLAENQTASAAVYSAGELKDATLHRLKHLFGKTVRMLVKDIDAEEPLESYGIDSIVITHLNQQLAEVFGALSKTLFYEYQTLDALAGYLLRSFPEICALWSGTRALEVSPLSAVSEPEFEPLKTPAAEVHAQQATAVQELTPAAHARFNQREPIAIIGIAGHYPAADSLDEYWQNLKAGRDCISEIPADRWSLDEYFEPDPVEAVAQRKSYGKWGGFLEGFADFDPLFFNMSPREALNVDPQERLFLTCSWELFEDAGYSRQELAERHRGRVGVFAGITKTGFDLYGPPLWAQGQHVYPHTSFGSVANRISYLFDLNGPSMPIDTMCSSSLVALHEACEHLYRDECEMALAGGVNLYLHPASFVSLSAQQMLSTDGRCRSFGAGGNGFVPGEGVGMVLLKPLSRALEAGDKIHGLIRGTSINHGGKTNGYTVPNPGAQAELVRKALQMAGVDARHVSYIEAHGTGTALGDPIEITGLTHAFRTDTKDTQFCAIGSAKSNIGHLEAAAGIAGLSKVLLQLKHRQLVPSLHAGELNPNIDFSATPFRVQHEFTPWKPSLDGRPLPRIAGISSFGAGGTNAHAVIEEYVQPPPRYRPGAFTTALILLSAADPERLQKCTQRLLAHVRANPGLDLYEIAFSLQVGREVMAHRLAFCAHSMAELESALVAYLSSEDSPLLYQGEANGAEKELQLLSDDEDAGAVFETWLRKGKFSKLLKLWVKGLHFDWRKLYSGSTPRRTSLPSYPFDLQRYWMPERYPAKTAISSEPARLHPLVHENISDFQRQCFRSRFSGKEFFLAHHVIQGSSILPGVAYFEMARAAGELAGRMAVTCIESLVWAQAIRFEQAPLTVDISLYAGEQTCDFEISTGDQGTGREPTVHAQGRLHWSDIGQTPKSWDIEAVRRRCTGQIAGEDMVARLEASGLGHAGPSFHAMTGLWFNAIEALAQLETPACVLADSGDYQLHPSMMDVAFESVQFLLSQDEATPQVRLPFALRSLRLYGPVTQQAFAYARPSLNPSEMTYDIDILDETGKVLVAFEGYTSVAAGLSGQSGLIYAGPVWREADLPQTNIPQVEGSLPTPHILLLPSLKEWESTLRHSWPGANVEHLSAAEDSSQEFIADFQAVVQIIQDQCFKAMQEDGPRPLLVLTRAGQDLAPANAYAALFKTARREHPALSARLVECAHATPDEALIKQLQAELVVDTEDLQLRLGLNDRRQVRTLEEVELEPFAQHCDLGVIWITGGLGGLGSIFARHFCTRPGVKLVLSGRSEMDNVGKALMAELKQNGAEPLYLQCDVSKEQEVRAAIETIVERFGGLNTILHSAGVVQDAYLRDKNSEHIQQVMAPKVAGVLALDRATRSLNLDNIVLFSSLAGSLGNPGQADYSAANAFLDSFAETRNRWVAEGKRRGRTISIAWPLWAHGGMGMDQENQDLLQRAVGMVAMDSPIGIEVFERALQAPFDRLVVAYGDKAKIRSLFQPARTMRAVAPPEPPRSADKPSENVLEQLVAVVAEQQDMDRALIDTRVELSQYGYDSIGFTVLSNRLNKLFGLQLMPTLFFEYSTLRALADYLAPQLKSQNLIVNSAIPATSGSMPSHAKKGGPDRLSPLVPGRFLKARADSHTSPVHTDGRDNFEPIAVIGMSGRFPGADSLEEFWEHLAANCDMSSEVPAERWNWRDCYGDPLREPGKTWVNRGNFLADVDRFDPLFFGMAPDEAELTDPQMRLFMETAWCAIEDAGYTVETLASSRSGVFVGVTNNDYQELLARSCIQAGSMEAGQTFAFAIPNRISYLLDFHGPSEAIDTACSSSLVAVHRAVQAIRQGNCELALAGGVNLMLTPSITISGGRLGTLSKDGRCKTFDQSADGYGRGEGVGAVFLKPLDKAVADGDSIHALIINSGENHGGKATSPSAPNPVAQADLLSACYREVGINPADIGYIEAHGTGTKLGDPIEINGLKSTFDQLYKERGLAIADSPHCVVGSVKANIGHLESAAGISGLIKVILMLRHRLIPGNPQLRDVNPYLQLNGSPLRLARDTEAWAQPRSGAPRLAGVSSFGVGGSNAHVIVGEFIDTRQRGAAREKAAEQGALIVLSARTEEQLTALAERLAVHLDAASAFTGTDGDSLTSIAYTLQTGRGAMRERLGFMAKSLDELRAYLRRFVDKSDPKDLAEGIFRGRAGSQKIASAEALTPSPDAVLDAAQSQSILRYWVSGGEVNWSALYAIQPGKARLPNYPFARNRYWVKLNSAAPKLASKGARLHPLLHINNSRFDRQCYITHFDGTEFFLTDHQVDGRKILPGVAYLEMARAAVAHAMQSGDKPILIRNMVWAKPLVMEDPATQEHAVQLEIALNREGDCDIGFELRSGTEKGWAVHARGTASLHVSDDINSYNIPSLNLESLRATCVESISAEQCYQRFAKLGFNYGPGLQGIQKVYSGAGQVLAQLGLPLGRFEDSQGFVLHPAIMDSALQASIGLLTDMSVSDLDSLPLPFALDSLEIHGSCPAQAWAWLRSSESTSPMTGGDLRKFDIDIADSQGRVFVRLRGLSSRLRSSRRIEPTVEASALVEVSAMLCRPVWNDVPVHSSSGHTEVDVHYLMFCQHEQPVGFNCPESIHMHTLASNASELNDRFEELSLQAFEFVRARLSATQQRILVQWIIPNTGEGRVLQGLSGLLKTACRENPALRNQIILVDEPQNSAALWDKIKQCAADTELDLLRYHKGRRQTLVWQEIPGSTTPIPQPWKENGVYLISGGAGGLGLLIAEQIVSQASVSLILVGRSSLNSERQQRLAALRRNGSRVEYRQLDVSRKPEVEELTCWIGAQFGPLNGVIHAAGKIRDNFMLNKTAEEFRAVLEPKLTGCVNLDTATTDQPLDFFLLFSSIAGVWGNAGQADYAAANAFMDAFAHYRNERRLSGERSGLTLSIDWPYWAQGGMRLDSVAIELMQKRTGLAPLGTEQAMAALRHSLSLNYPQVMVLAGDTDQLRAHLRTQGKSVEVDSPASAATTSLSEEGLAGGAVEYFRDFLATALKLPKREVQTDELFEQYGIDSVRVMQLTSDLETVFGSLPKTLFFEYQTLEELSRYFLSTHAQRLSELLQGEQAAAASTLATPSAALHIIQAGVSITAVTAETARLKTVPLETVPLEKKAPSKTSPYKASDIAIIGLAGRYPKAPNLAAFWDNLQQGRDCISEIPASRWDWRSFYVEQGMEFGRHSSKYGGFLEDIDCFDPMFFNISPLEAEFMDPQERLFIETAWHAIEDAGYNRQSLEPGGQGAFSAEDLPGAVGVYAGLMYSEYQLYAAESCARGKPLSLSGSYAGLANRVSFIFNLHGPSMTVDTMCSSSLSCLHLACQDLKLGVTDMAIAGGVNLSIHPNKYTMLSGGRFISTRGYCESFGQGGEGYIPSEGVGVAILKRLTDAERDGDSIYGVIKGSALSHGGKTNGYSVPNPKAQQMAITRALKDAGIDPRAISYVEAHGTGTKLGDPIEIAGLSRAYRAFTEDNQYCWLGSVKSNIGHCEAAAGIAGLTKVLLQLKHGQIAPSLHSKVLNPHIDFASSPFTVNQTLREWQRPTIDGKTQPRVAGVSSFGAGGSNAHMVIQEYVREPRTDYPSNEPQLLPLSATDEVRLAESIQSLLAFVCKHPKTPLAEMAFTLQVGREAMPERLALVVNSLGELRHTLQALVDDLGELDNVFRGSVKSGKSSPLRIIDKDTSHSWPAKMNLHSLAEAWVEGRKVNWRELHGENPPLRISLPSYPFARERYWAPDGPAAVPNASSARSQSPLAKSQTKVVEDQHAALYLTPEDAGLSRFSTVLSGDEFFLTDHRVRQQKVLPGVVYLELARSAADQYGARPIGDSRRAFRTELRNLVWARPIVVEDRARRVQIALEPDSRGELGFKVLTESAVGSGNAQVVHSQGVVAWIEKNESPRIDLSALQKRINGHRLQAGQCYELFTKAGIEYGPAQQALTEVYSNQGSVLAKLNLPSGLSASRQDFVLHPSLMDAALQACIGLITDQESSIATSAAAPALPYALDTLQIHGECSEEMWVWIRPSDSTGGKDRSEAKYRAGASQPGKLDLDLCDSQGRVAVSMRGLAFRPLKSMKDDSSLLLAVPRWREKPITGRLAGPTFVQRYVLACDWPASAALQLPDGVHLLQLDLSDGSLDVRYRELGRRMFEAVRQLLERHSTEAVLLQVLVPDLGDQQTYVGLCGLLKTLHLENPNFTVQMILAEPVWFARANFQGELLRTNERCTGDVQIRYRDRIREALSWETLAPNKFDAPTMDTPVWKDGGVYLVTGGAGGLGAIVAGQIAERSKHPRLVLTGRSALGPSISALLEQLKARGASAEYRQVDVTDEPALRRLVDEIIDRFGGLNGILHTAGITRDAFLLHKNPQDVDAVLSPKVSGTVNLQRVTRDRDVDFLMLFSSLAGVSGNPGQGDYATANGFMDAFAHYHHRAWAKGTRVLSVNWPLWEEGGMQMNAAALKIMRARTGMVPLESGLGMQALEMALRSTEVQLSVMQGDLPRLQALLESVPALAGESINAGSKEQSAQPQLSEPQLSESRLSEPELLKKGIEHFKALLAGKMKIPNNRIRANEPLQQYGMDSIIAMQLVDELAQTFGSLPQTLFFEYQSIEDLCRYFLEHHPQAFGELLGEAQAAAPAPSAPKHIAAIEEGPLLKTVETDIAVIGLCGRYPQAANLDDFWSNLCQGKDCISEVPKQRWDHDLYFEPDRSKVGKSYSKWGGFIEDVDKFDAAFFNISPNQAQIMDPQERLFLQTVWELIEGAGYTREALRERFKRKVGVFVGTMYQPYHAFDADLIRESLISLSSHASIANRVSYFFDFQGPSIAIDTMCSSSLMAVHMACESLLNGAVRMAVAGGVNLSIHPKKYIGLCAAQMIGSTPKSRSFAQGDGYIPAEGVGAVLLKPLAQAMEDGDQIHAVIKSAAANHGGSTHGFNLPNLDAQTGLIEDNFRKSGIDPRTISYVESAANGSALGDAIEMRALIRAFRAFTPDTNFCSIGSVKANIGHAEAASGISQLSKVILQLRHRQLPPVLLQASLNPEITFEGSPFYLQQSLEEWKRPVIEVNGELREIPLRATVSSFGAGGSNAHLIVEEYIPAGRPKPTLSTMPIVLRPINLVVLSARSLERLKVAAENLADFLREAGDVSMAGTMSMEDLAYTLQVGREAMHCRLAIVVSDLKPLVTALEVFSASGDAAVSNNVFYGEGDNQVDEGLAPDLTHWPDEQQWRQLARSWVGGAQLDWSALYQRRKPQRLLLPTYPFKKKRHWLGDTPPKLTQPAEDVVADSKDSKVHESLYAFIAEITGLSLHEIIDSARLADLGLDSLMRMRLLNRINGQWNITFDTDLMMGDKCLGDLIGSVEAVLVQLGKSDKVVPAEYHNALSPFFIQSVTWPLQPSANPLSPKQHEEALQVLGGLCAQGVGVWRDEQGLCFEFFEQTQSEESLRRLISKPAALASILELGKRYYPASHMQQIALDETEVKGRGTFNLLQACWVDAPVNPALLEQALNALVGDHAIFRTEARRIGDTWVQVVHDSLQIKYREVCWPDITERKDFEQALQDMQKRCSAQLHDIHQGPLFDLYLVHNKAGLAALLFHTHHFHVDGFSFFAFQRELLLRYQTLAQPLSNYEPLASQVRQRMNRQGEYAHFAMSQFDPDNQRHTRFWIERFADKNLGMGFQDCKADLKGVNGKAGYLEFELSPKRLEALKRFNRDHNTTLTQLVSSAWTILLWRATGLNLPVQMVNNLRDRIEFETVMGDFSSALPMILDINSGTRVCDLFRAYDQAMADLQRHKRCNVPELRRCLSSQQEGDEQGAHDWCAVTIDSNDRDSLLDVTGFTNRVIPLKPEDRDPPGQLLILVVKTDDRLRLSYLYDTSRLSHKSMKLIVAGMDSLLKQMVAKPECSICELSIPNQLEKQLSVRRN